MSFSRELQSVGVQTPWVEQTQGQVWPPSAQDQEFARELADAIDTPMTMVIAARMLATKCGLEVGNLSNYKSHATDIPRRMKAGEVEALDALASNLIIFERSEDRYQTTPSLTTTESFLEDKKLECAALHEGSPHLRRSQISNLFAAWLAGSAIKRGMISANRACNLLYYKRVASANIQILEALVTDDDVRAFGLRRSHYYESFNPLEAAVGRFDSVAQKLDERLANLEEAYLKKILLGKIAQVVGVATPEIFGANLSPMRELGAGAIAARIRDLARYLDDK